MRSVEILTPQSTADVVLSVWREICRLRGPQNAKEMDLCKWLKKIGKDATPTAEEVRNLFPWAFYERQEQCWGCDEKIEYGAYFVTGEYYEAYYCESCLEKILEMIKRAREIG